MRREISGANAAQTSMASIQTPGFFAQIRKDRKSYLFVLPAVIGCCVFTLFPILYNIYLSTLSWDLTSNDRSFVGINNYIHLLHDSEFLQSLGETVVFSAAGICISIFLALLLAVWLNKNTKLHYFIQSCIFTPYIVSLVSISMLWMWIMDYDNGCLNFFLSLFHIAGVHWLDSPSFALASLVIIQIWQTLGYNTLILIAGLQSIPGNIYESARLDKSKSITTFWKITIPMVSPSLFFLIIINIIDSFQVFTLISVITKGGPVNSTNLLVFWIYQTGFGYYNIGSAATGSVFLTVIIAIITFLYFRTLSHRVHYQ
jgi:sn-glycerol 3-phosphate transport system permease protein